MIIYICKECGENFHFSKKYVFHMMTKHKKSLRECLNEDIDPFNVCSICKNLQSGGVSLCPSPCDSNAYNHFVLWKEPDE